jgi:LacI family transcriptional regulator
VPFRDADTDEGRGMLREFFTRYPELDAVYFSTNYLTRNGIEILRQVNGSIDRIGIVTFDDNDLFRINTPSITAVAQPLEQLAETLMQTMLSLLKQKREGEGKKGERERIILQAELIPRGSSVSLSTR